MARGDGRSRCARSGGGAWLDDNNLITACNPCNSIKADFTLEQLGWQLQPIVDDGWDGLTMYFARLWQAAGQPKILPRYFPPNHLL
jgi:hypothetical protein